MIKKIKKIIICIVGVLIVLSLIICVLYLIDKNKRLEELESNSQLAKTSVGTIEYKIYGDKGLVILSIHGSPGGYDQGWPYEGFRVLSISRPGYLRTPLQVGETPAEQAQAYSALLEYLGIKQVIVSCASGGGPSAICFAALFPEKTIALIAVEAVSQSIAPYDDPFKSDLFTWMLFTLMQNDTCFNSMLKTLIPENEATRQLMIKDPIKNKMLQDLIWTMWPRSKRAVGLQNDRKQFQLLTLPVSEVKVPTLIIHGSEDELPVNQSIKLAEQIPGSRLEIIKGADHLMPVSHYEEIGEICGEFLEDINIIKKVN